MAAVIQGGQSCIMDRDVDDPCSGIKVQKLDVGVSGRRLCRVCVHCGQVGHRPPRGMHLEHQWKVCPLAILTERYP